MPDWDTVSTAFLVAVAVALPLLFALYIWLQLALAQVRTLVTEILASEVVQALAGAAALAGGKKGGEGGSVKTIVASKGMDLLGHVLGMR